MEEFKVNFIDGIVAEKNAKEDIAGKKISRGRWLFRLTLFFLLVVGLFSASAVSLKQSTLGNFSRLSFWEGTFRFVTGCNKILVGEHKDRINILLLGIGGPGHEGEYLTDAMILLSIKPSINTISLLSIPRDLYVPIEGSGWRKINFAYALGVSQGKSGGELASSTVEKIFDIPIHYWAVVDFNNFIELIDWFGGLRIDVPKGFTDHHFPGPNYSWRTVTFKTGPQLMDGKRVLEYVRSRHGSNGEGSDFARSKRQQQVLLALKEKIKQTNVLGPKQIWYFYNFFASKIQTNLTISEALSLAKLLSKSPDWHIQQFALNDSNLLKPVVGPKGAYILRPRTGNFDELAYLAKNIFKKGNSILNTNYEE